MKLLATIALLSVLSGQVMTLECLIGQTTVFSNQTTIGKMVPANCGFDASGISHSCLRHDLDITYQGLKATMSIGSCIISNHCLETSCDTIGDINSNSDEKLIKSCCVSCCKTDRCNSNPATSANGECNGSGDVVYKPWLMIALTLTAILYSYIFK